MKILFLTNVPSPYRVLFFNELGKYCDLTVLYQKKDSSERDSKWIEKIDDTYKTVFMKGKSTGVDNAFCPEVIRYIKDKSYNHIVICGISSPTEIVAIEWCKLHHRAYILEGDGAFAKSGRGLKETLKTHLIKGAELYFSTSREHDKYYLQYGAEKSRIVRYPFTSLLEAEILNRPLRPYEKAEFRRKLGIGGKQVVLSVGQFIYRKGFDVLLSIAEQVNAEIYIVGGEPTEEYLRGKSVNVHFEGFKTKSELKDYYKASDVFVLPTREDIWGLVVNEALANALPVVTTDKCIAGLEMIDNGENGYVVPSDDAQKLLEGINLAFELNAGYFCINTAKKYTIEKMVKVHVSAFSNK